MLKFDDVRSQPSVPVRDGVEPDARAVLALDDVLRQHLASVLQISGGRINGPGGAAELLKLNPSTLRQKLRKLGIPFGRRAVA